MRESEPEKRRKSLIYIRLTNVQEHLYPHKGAFSEAPFFVARPVEGGGWLSPFCKGLDRFPEPEAESKPEKTVGWQKSGQRRFGLPKTGLPPF